MENEEPYVPPFVRRVMKDATEEEVLEATARLQRYLKAMLAIYRSIEERRRRCEINRLRELNHLNEGEALIGLS